MFLFCCLVHILLSSPIFLRSHLSCWVLYRAPITLQTIAVLQILNIYVFIVVLFHTIS